MSPPIAERHYELHRLVNLHPGTLGELAELAIRQHWDLLELEEEQGPDGYRWGEETLPEYTARLEGRVITQALGRTGHNVTAAARLLGVRRAVLQYRLQQMAWRTEGRPDAAGREEA